MADLTAPAIIAALHQHSSAVEREKIQRYFKSGAGEYGEGDLFVGVCMGQLLLTRNSSRACAWTRWRNCSKAPFTKSGPGPSRSWPRKPPVAPPPEHDKRRLFDLYLRRIDRINNWDLVDLGAWDVVGRYLADQPRGVLDELALSGDVWERRTAVLATLFFLRRGGAATRSGSPGC